MQAEWNHFTGGVDASWREKKNQTWRRDFYLKMIVLSLCVCASVHVRVCHRLLCVCPSAPLFPPYWEYSQGPGFPRFTLGCIVMLFSPVIFPGVRVVKLTNPLVSGLIMSLGIRKIKKQNQTTPSPLPRQQTGNRMQWYSLSWVYCWPCAGLRLQTLGDGQLGQVIGQRGTKWPSLDSICLLGSVILSEVLYFHSFGRRREGLHGRSSR